MAHGKPVIAVKGQGITNIVLDNNVDLLVPPNNVSAVAEAIINLNC
jgi:glycosyltransferase involved in cell wall biosynthesis